MTKIIRYEKGFKTLFDCSYCPDKYVKVTQHKNGRVVWEHYCQKLDKPIGFPITERDVLNDWFPKWCPIPDEGET